jgi:hypothetical protein
MEATEVEVVARATAVRNWSESAARWEVWLWPVVVWVVFCECLLQDAGHSHVIHVFDVARVDGVYAVPYGSVDRFVGAFGDCGGSEDKHVEVEE